MRGDEGAMGGDKFGISQGVSLEIREVLDLGAQFAGFALRKGGGDG